MVSPAGTFFIVLFVLIVVAAVGWVAFTQLRARRLGLPSPPLSSYIPFLGSSASSQSPYGPPQPAPGGIRGWMQKLRGGNNTRTAAGAYEGAPASYGGRRGFGALDPDEAWDTRVGNEADIGYGPGGYYEEQELGLRPTHGAGAGASYDGSVYNSSIPRGDSEERGRSHGLNLPPHSAAGQNPFDDSAAEPSNLSLRGVSPRPIDTAMAARGGGASNAKANASGDSPTSTHERRSIFRENV